MSISRTINVVASSDAVAWNLAMKLMAILGTYRNRVTFAQKSITSFPGVTVEIRFIPHKNCMGTESHSMPMLDEPATITRGNTPQLRSGNVGEWFSRIPTDPPFIVVHITDGKEPRVEYYCDLPF